MKRELLDKWLAALRGGKYEQTSGYLQDTDGFCCLGVLCDVMDPTAWTIEGYKFTDGSTNDAVLPSNISKDLGLMGMVDFVDGNGETKASLLSERLMTMNDTEEKTFAEIADYIEQNLDPTFV